MRSGAELECSHSDLQQETGGPVAPDWGQIINIPKREERKRKATNPASWPKQVSLLELLPVSLKEGSKGQLENLEGNGQTH
jgi:hypothetical protein